MSRPLEFMACICTDKPNPECWQYDHHLENAGEPNAFPRSMFPELTPRILYALDANGFRPATDSEVRERARWTSPDAGGGDAALNGGTE